MDIASHYAEIIGSRLLRFAAWSPITDPYEVDEWNEEMLEDEAALFE